MQKAVDVSKEAVGKVGKSHIYVGRFTYGYDTIEIKEWGEGANLFIGQFCSIADGIVAMLGGSHRVDWATTFPFGHIFPEHLGNFEIEGHPKTNGDIEIGNDVWIGRRATIMSGVKIGDGAVIAANSTVTKDIGCYEIWGGNPAKKIKNRFDDEVKSYLMELKWWDFDLDIIRKIAPLLSVPPSIEILDKVRLISEGR